MRHRAKFRESRSNRSRLLLWPIFDLSRWRPSAILDLFYACWDHPRRVLGGLCDCAKFSCNRCSNFDSMQILIFCTISLKMPIHASKIGVLGILPQNGEQYERDPQKVYPWAETPRMAYRSSKSVYVCGLGASRRIIAKTFLKVYLIIKVTKTGVFTCSPRPPTLSQRHMNLHVWAYPRPGYIFQVSSKSV